MQCSDAFQCFCSGDCAPVAAHSDPDSVATTPGASGQGGDGSGGDPPPPPCNDGGGGGGGGGGNGGGGGGGDGGGGGGGGGSGTQGQRPPCSTVSISAGVLVAPVLAGLAAAAARWL